MASEAVEDVGVLMPPILLSCGDLLVIDSCGNLSVPLVLCLLCADGVNHGNLRNV